ncbi:MAG: SUMF1/EgtB/PvdO family nonheme iron enzyme [Pirellulaceae bacterium]|nr:SUMF1/EgtB/PvdO family nonheme iron enzyme [Pirellulaceae bacterium]
MALLKPNDSGLFDMHGNAYEWCFDLFDDYAVGPDKTAIDAPSKDAVSDTQSRVLRSTAFDARSSGLRSASRAPYRPSSRSSTTGFRPVRTYDLTH